MKRGLKLSASIPASFLSPPLSGLKPCRVAEDYNDLHAYSVSTYTFWLDLWDFMGIIASVPPRPDQVRCHHRALAPGVTF